jgi:predicted RNA-binding protein YlxR (DUF448 family)
VRTRVRTCVGCRKAVPAESLVRLILTGSPVVQLVVVRPGRPRPAGRGAWLHPVAACISAAARSRAFDRAFRAPVGPVDVEALSAAVSAAALAKP